MRASAAVGLLLASSMSVFGIMASYQHSNPDWGIEPVWVNGQMGVYSPSTGQFVPSTSPMYPQVCDEIRRRRAENDPYGAPGGGGYYNHHYYGSGFGGSSYRGGSFWGGSSGSSHSFGSVRGGIGSIGHSFGGSHS